MINPLAAMNGFIAVIIFLASPAMAGAPLAGMGGVGVGVADSYGDITANPAAAAAADIGRHEGLATMGFGWRRLVFSGHALNADVSTQGVFDSVEALGWSFVTPMIGPGRVGAGVWQVERRGLFVEEPLDLDLSVSSGGPALSTLYYSGNSSLQEDEAIYALGAVWIQPLSGGDHQVAAGLAYLNQTMKAGLAVKAENLAGDAVLTLRDLAQRRELGGPGVMAGYFYRPMPGGSLGVSVLYIGKMNGRIWETADGGPLYRDDISRDPQVRVAVGGSLSLLSNLVVGLDLRYAGETARKSRIFEGTPAERVLDEKSEATFSVSTGVEYRLRWLDADMPLRAGFYTRPDPFSAPVAGSSASSVDGMMPAAFKQDLMVVTAGTGWEKEGFRADIALEWLLVDTRVKLPSGAETVESGDVRNSFGAVASLGFRFGRIAAPTR